MAADGTRMTGQDALRSNLAARKARLRNLSPAMRVVGEEIVLRVSDSFRRRSSPAGEAWEVLAPSTLARRAAKVPGARRRGKSGRLTKGALEKRKAAVIDPAAIVPLIDTGRMRASAGRYKATRDGLTWSVVRYGGAHMAGTKDGRVPARNFSPFVKVGGHWRPIPALAVFVTRSINRYLSLGVP